MSGKLSARSFQKTEARDVRIASGKKRETSEHPVAERPPLGPTLPAFDPSRA
jgi:hypothetical protein